MAAYPTDGLSAGTWGAECSAYHAVSTDLSTGKILLLAQKVSAMTGAESDRVVADKGYVDDLAQDGSETEKFSGASPTSFTDLDLSSVVGTQKVQANITVENTDATNAIYSFRKNGSTNLTVKHELNTAEAIQLSIVTDTSGVIEWMTNSSKTTAIRVNTFIRLG